MDHTPHEARLPSDPDQALRDQLEPWQQAVAAPATAQRTVLLRLLDDYARTGYGIEHNAAGVAAADAALYRAKKEGRNQFGLQPEAAA